VLLASPPLRARNAPEQYDDLADAWWDARGPFAALHWLADTRAELVPAPSAPGALLVDLGCGGGLMAPRLPAGFRHVGVDRNAAALAHAAAHGVETVQADVTATGLAGGEAEVVLAGELIEHVEDLPALVAEIGRLLAPGGVVVWDTINQTRWARLSLVTVGERMPGGPPRHIHDPALFVTPERLQALLAAEGVALEEQFGLQVAPLAYLRFLVDRSTPVRMVRTRSLAALYAGRSRKAAA
jgi:2-polyprenyl-6-hydroxyphenyl methylase / 3-demethylubiquinone-9 3-methyltransferase